MKIERVVVEGISLLDICECYISKIANQHCTAIISGHIDDKNEESYFRKSLVEEWLTIYGITEGGAEIELFGGYVKDFSLLKIDGQKAVQISLESGTVLMDLIKRRLTYQDLTETYRNIVDGIVSKYINGVVVANYTADNVIGSMKVQYEETDWEFIKRLASNIQQVVIPHAHKTSVVIDFGLNETVSETRILDVLEEKIFKEKQGISYGVKTKECFDIGAKIEYKERVLFVYSVKSIYEKGELIHEYILKDKNQFVGEKYCNDKIIGASLSANVTAIERDEVKVCVIGEDGVKQKWFSYATVYSSPDGTGWYCMPEPGDRVRIYFPTNEEQDAYVINSTHLPVTESDSESEASRTNPDNKSIKNKDGKEILLTPEKILITNNKGMSIEINDEQGISIISDKKIIMESNEGIDMISKSKGVNIIASEEINLQQSGSCINLKDDVTISGGKVKNV